MANKMSGGGKRVLKKQEDNELEVVENARKKMKFKFNSWVKAVETMKDLFTRLCEHPNVIISIFANEDGENLLVFIRMVKWLDDELTQIFQSTDCHSTDYIEKLRGEPLLCQLIEKAQQYVDSRRQMGPEAIDQDEVLIIYGLRIEHLYYKFSQDEAESEQLMESLCKVVYSYGRALLPRQRAMLCQIYHHALHNRWHKARNLMLMSHLQSLVEHSDPGTQVLYNRTICQLGLCAFRHGLIREAHQSLAEIQNTQRAKELLAQGIPPRQQEKTPEQVFE